MRAPASMNMPLAAIVNKQIAEPRYGDGGELPNMPSSHSSSVGWECLVSGMKLPNVMQNNDLPHEVCRDEDLFLLRSTGHPNVTWKPPWSSRWLVIFSTSTSHDGWAAWLRLAYHIELHLAGAEHGLQASRVRPYCRGARHARAPLKIAIQSERAIKSESFHVVRCSIRLVAPSEVGRTIF